MLNPGEARHRFEYARAAYLATLSPADGPSAAPRPHIVPVTFALSGDELVTIIDHKPKTTDNLQRLRNIDAEPQVSLLIDYYNEDWHRLWWARADGIAVVMPPTAPDYSRLRSFLVEKYPQYQAELPSGQLIRVAVHRWSGWAAAVDDED